MRTNAHKQAFYVSTYTHTFTVGLHTPKHPHTHTHTHLQANTPLICMHMYSCKRLCKYSQVFLTFHLLHVTTCIVYYIGSRMQQKYALAG